MSDSRRLDGHPGGSVFHVATEVRDSVSALADVVLGRRTLLGMLLEHEPSVFAFIRFVEYIVRLPLQWCIRALLTSRFTELLHRVAPIRSGRVKVWSHSSVTSGIIGIDLSARRGQYGPGCELSLALPTTPRISF